MKTEKIILIEEHEEMQYMWKRYFDMLLNKKSVERKGKSQLLDVEDFLKGDGGCC